MNTLAARAAVLVVVLVTLLAGCDLRLATPAPAAPSPGAVEQVRARTVAQTLALSAQAQALRPAAAAPVAAVLDDLVGQATTQVAALGGVYRPVPPTGSPTPTPTPTGGTGDLLAALAAATSTAATDTDQVTDGRLARLLAAVATARGELVVRLAAALGQPVPAATPSATPTTTPSPGAPPSSAGPGRAAVLALVLAHDQAGYGLEVIAAQLRGSRLTPTLAAARTHRAAAQALADQAGVSGTDADPRRAQYLLPGGLSDASTAAPVAAALETAVADAYAAALVDAGPGARGDLLTGLRTATAAARGWGAAPVALPGMPATAVPTASPGSS